jgi:hypothetical protein
MRMMRPVFDYAVSRGLCIACSEYTQNACYIGNNLLQNQFQSNLEQIIVGLSEFTFVYIYIKKKKGPSFVLRGNNHQKKTTQK